MKRLSMLAEKCGVPWNILTAGLFLAVVAASASATDWSTVQLVPHQTYQAIQYNETSGKWDSAYTGGFPARLQGVVLNANEDWQNPTVSASGIGGQAEIVVQTADTGNDFGGTFCWMGQNYGVIQGSPAYNYTEQEWYEELDRLRLSHPAGYGVDPLPPEQLVRPGDYIEVRARAGLYYYKAKMNVNEMHLPDPNKDFEIVVLDQGRGWDAPVELTLANIKEIDPNPASPQPENYFFFDTGAPRDSGAEHYQGTLVALQNVSLVSGTWGPGNTVVVTDGNNRFMNLRLGLGAGLAAYPPTGTFNVTGIMDQDTTTVGNNKYRLLTMDSGDVFQRWAGGGGSWSAAANWGGNALLGGEGAHFSGTGGTATNDTENRVVGGIVFETGAGAYTLDGEAVTLTGDIVSFSTAAQTVALDMTLGDDEITLYPAAGDLVIESALENDGYLRKIGYGAVDLAGGVSGNGTLHVTNGALTASSVVQGKLIIGGVTEETTARTAQGVPEPSVWLMLLAAGLFVSRRTAGYIGKIRAKPQAV